MDVFLKRLSVVIPESTFKWNLGRISEVLKTLYLARREKRTL